jgi:BirA family biotin operon repressor/biotin-[acetyl-CoA-carboxylase] ligase
MLGGLAALEATKAHTSLHARLKWPNDLVLPSGGRWLKFGGMLLEGQLSDGQWVASVLGIGINVNIQPRQIPESRTPATSLLKESGSPINRARLLGALLTSLERGYEAAEQGHSPQKAWQGQLMTIGQQVTVSQLDKRPSLSGIAISTDAWGRLIVRDADGQEHAVAAGDVTLQVDNSGD